MEIIPAYPLVLSSGMPILIVFWVKLIGVIVKISLSVLSISVVTHFLFFLRVIVFAERSATTMESLFPLRCKSVRINAKSL